MPRKYDDDDDVDDLPVRKKEMGPLDGMFKDTSMVILVIFACCCNGIALILGIIALVTAKDPTAKSNAMTVTIIAGIVTFLGVIGQIARIAINVGGLK